MFLRHLAFRLASSASSAREETLDGKRYVVAPVVASRVGVLDGSLITAAAWRRLTPFDRDVPLTADHPREQREGEDFFSYVAARGTDIEQRQIGFFRNARLVGVDNNAKPAGEVWIEADSEQGKRAAEKTLAGEKIEVSIGAIVTGRAESGTYEGVEYSSVVEDGHIDHLAVLMDGRGWCSVEKHGCGVNQLAARQRKALAAIDVPLPGDLSARSMIVSDAVRESFRRDNPRDLDSLEGFVFVQGITASEAFFERDKQNFRVGYSYQDAAETDDGKPVVELEEPVALRFNLGLTNITTASAKIKAALAALFTGGPMNKKEMIDALKADGKLTAKTAAELERMDDESVKQIYELKASAAESSAEPQPSAEDKEKADLVTALAGSGDFTKERLEAMDLCDLRSIAKLKKDEPKAADADEPNVEKIVEKAVGKAVEKVAEKFKGLDAVLAKHQREQQAEEEAKAQLVASLSANERCEFEKDELEAMPLGHLQKLSTTIAPRSFMGVSGGAAPLPAEAAAAKAAAADADKMYAEPKPN